MSDNLPALSVPVTNNLPTNFSKGLSATDFLPRLQLITSKSDHVSNGFPVNHFALFEGSGDPEDIGAEVDTILLSARPLFLDTSAEPLQAFHYPAPDEEGTPTCPNCLSIVERSAMQNSGCMWGVEFLVWIARRKSYATLFLGSNSARRETDRFLRVMGVGITLYAKKIESKKFKTSWSIPTVRTSSTLTDLPDPEGMAAQVAKFNEPKDSEVEAAQPVEAGRKR